MIGNAQESTGDAAELDHRRYISLNTRQGNVVEVVDSNLALECVGVEDSSNETFINTTSGTHETKGCDSKPQSPVESLLGQVAPTHAENVQSRPASHFDGLGGRMWTKEDTKTGQDSARAEVSCMARL